MTVDEKLVKEITGKKKRKAKGKSMSILEI